MLNRLSPIWGAALGFSIPLSFLRNVDGHVHVEPWHEIVLIYANAWATNLVWVAVFCALYCLAFVPTHWLARERSQRLFDFGAVAIGRMLLLMSMTTMMADWLNIRQPGFTKLNPRPDLVLVVIVGLAIAATWRTAQPGPLLVLSRRIARWSSALLLLVPLAAWLEWRDSRPSPDPAALRAGERPDVVLITLDTLAADRMSLYGGPRPTTPALEAFARGATVFDHAYANSNYTTSSVASIMLGVRPWTHRALQLFSRPVDGVVEHNLLRQFDEAGYEVITVDTNYHASPTQQRLRRWVDAASWGRVQSVTFACGHLGRWLPQFGPGSGTGATVGVINFLDRLLVDVGWLPDNSPFDPALALDDARRLWEASTGKPRFLWVHLYGGHEPYAATPEFLGRFDSSPDRRTRFNSYAPYLFAAQYAKGFPDRWTGRYDELLLMTDHHVGDFLAWLQTRGEFDGSLIAITADHGESFGHRYGGHGGPLLWEDLVRIPLLLKRPGQQAGERNATLVEQIDLAPTLASLAGLQPDAAYEGAVISLDQPDAGGDAWSMNLEQSPRFGPVRNGTIALVQDRWKYVHHFGRQHYPYMPALKDALFDLVADPGELTDIVAQQPQVAAQMKAAIEAELARHAAAVH